jgi:hypothetical protein
MSFGATPDSHDYFEASGWHCKVASHLAGIELSDDTSQ